MPINAPALRERAGSLEKTPATTRNQPSNSAAPRCIWPIQESGPPPITASRSGRPKRSRNPMSCSPWCLPRILSKAAHRTPRNDPGCVGGCARPASEYKAVHAKKPQETNMSTFDPLRPTLVCLAALLTCGCAGVAHADENDATLGVALSVTLPEHAKGKPPTWAGKAY